MKRPTRRKVAIFAGLLLFLLTGAAIVYRGQPRVLAQSSHPNGSSRVIVAKPRLCGLLGIEIVLENRAKDGTKTYGSVQDLLGSWEEATRRYENPEGGGLLEPLSGSE